MSLSLYHLTLRPPTLAIASVLGLFQAKKSQEIAVITSSYIELYTASTTTGKLTRLLRQPVFASVRCACSYRLAGVSRDYLLVTSDSGMFSVLEFDTAKMLFVPVFNEPFAKTGLRRLSPGQFISQDAKGRAVMLTAIEKNRLVYVLNRDSDNNLTISLPLEANRGRVLTLATCGLDVGYENPVFAALECGIKGRSLTFYELDLGLNHVVKKHDIEVPETSNYLLALPGGDTGPLGVLVASKGFISYHSVEGHKCIVPIPRDVSKKKVNHNVVCGTVHILKDSFFALLQLEDGAIFKLTFRWDESTIAMDISYFDTIPVCRNMLVLRSGFLYADTERGDAEFYQFVGIGSNPVIHSSEDFYHTHEDVEGGYEPTDLTNLQLVDVLLRASPSPQALITTKEERVSISALTAAGLRSQLRFLERGWAVDEIAVSELPEKAQNVFTVRSQALDDYERYLILSLPNSTMVLSLGESVEEVEDTGLKTDVSSIEVTQMGSSLIVQVYSDGVIHLNQNKVVEEWLPPAGIKILCCSLTSHQLALGLLNREIVYLELNDVEKLTELGSRTEMAAQIILILLGDIPDGRLRSPFLAIVCNNNTLTLARTGKQLEHVSTQELSANALSVLICNMREGIALHIGLENGIYVRTLIDSSSGRISDRIVQYLGPRAVKLGQIELTLNEDREPAVLVTCGLTSHVAFSTKSTGFKLVPVAFSGGFERGASFSLEEYENGLVGVRGNEMCIVAFEGADEEFKTVGVDVGTNVRKLCELNGTYYLGGQNEDSAHLIKVEGETPTKQADINGKITSVLSINFKQRGTFLVVGVQEDQSPYIYCYSVDQDGNLAFVHKTKTEKPVHCAMSFAGKLLVGVGNILRWYDMGQKQLLRKAESKLDSINTIVRLETQGYRIYVGDLRESVTYVVFKPAMNSFIPFADDVVARHVTALGLVDYDTVVGGDKFGNIWGLRCPKNVSELSDEEPLGSFITSQTGIANGSPNKLDLVCHYYIGDICTAIHKKKDAAGLNECVIYTGLQGTIGVLVPFTTKTEAAFFEQLEREISKVEEVRVLGRDHLMYRGYYAPRKGVVDGDLCERYGVLGEKEKREIALKMERTEREIERRVVDLRLRVVL